MRLLTETAAALSVAVLAGLAAGCNKAPAEAAIQAADQALEAAEPELARYTPEELAALRTAVSSARTQLAKGNYTEALKTAQGLPMLIDDAVEAAAAKKEELVRAWGGITRAVEPRLAALTARVGELSAAQERPKGEVTPAVASFETDLGAIMAAWARAGLAFEGGDVPGAVRMARDVQAKAQALGGRIGLAPAARPAVPMAR
jgi:hypothetical protein